MHEPGQEGAGLPFMPQIEEFDLRVRLDGLVRTRFDRPLETSVREARLLEPASIRTLGRLPLEVTTFGWRFPAPAIGGEVKQETTPPPTAKPPAAKKKPTRLRPPGDVAVFKDRLLYLLQPPLENLFAGKEIKLPFQPFKYQLEGIAFLMPRHAALLADEMGLGKTAQAIVALRLLFHAGLIRNALLICPKPLVTNWSRELRSWAEDLPFEVIAGDTQTRRAAWLVSNCPLKVVNYEILTRDADILDDERAHFDVVVLDEAQRIKNSGSKTAEVVCSIKRSRSWALTGTPIENKHDDLVNIFNFVDPERIPHETPARRLPEYTSDCILR
ncbi:MAG TPA: SNF2-related protein, partial [Gemmataceae bacterium]|nr:SNF2-related protein [Gemmataceae bacterium]